MLSFFAEPLSPLSLPKLPWTYPLRPAEKSPEMALVLESKSVGNLLHGKRSRQQQRLSLLDKILRYTFVGSAPRNLLHYIGNIFW